MSRESAIDKNLNRGGEYLNVVNANGYSAQQQQSLVNAVISVLQGPDQATMVSKQYSNERNLATEVQAYAKISGKDWTYYVKGLEISIGRNTDTVAVAIPNVDVKDGPQAIDIDLGPAKVVSRKHAIIKFNMQHGGWELLVLGRNGAKVNFKRVQVGPAAPPVLLTSGTILDIGGTQMMFILPEQEPFISQTCISHLIPKLVARYGSAVNDGYRSSDPNALLYDILKESDYMKRQPLRQPQQQIRTFKMYGNGTSSHAEYGPSMQLNADSHFMNGVSKMDNSGVMLPSGTSNGQMNQTDLNLSYSNPSQSLTQIGFPQSLDFASDLSRDENKNVKPPHSYATMITQAILSTKEGVISLADIYKYISSNYAYYRFAKTGWQNSIRHNLSLNKAFEKVPRRPNEPGKGMKWRISEDYQRDFLSKWNAGKIGKVRRGSSVARQLQLHLSKYNSLPSQSDYPPEQTVIKLQTMHSRSKMTNQPNMLSQPQSQSQLDSSSISASPAEAVSVPPSQNMLRSDQQTSSSQQLQSTRLMPPPTSGPHISQNPTNNALVSFTNASASTASAVPSAGSYSNTPKNVPPIITNTSSSASHLSPSHTSILRSPTKAFHITAMEAYTPERGSAQQRRSPVTDQNNDPNLLTAEDADRNVKKSSNNDGAQDVSNGATGEKLTNRSSPGVWNLLQFSSVNNTPAVINNNDTKNSSAEGPSRTVLNREAAAESDTKDVASSPLKRQQNQEEGKELMLDTDGAKITLVNE
ncbi:hypothetical protein HG536_0B02880 [Torulaspora globosa]|uniref:Fork-head domain-containing protein n=1 Tax=Torulaspora globosa TaxID=48254 RepID=A0A7G3ZD39_9SACH|nr:uncharacterized protein HG536_0B02880 [Torulaspora globosa]QLL31425.1 hypothetical protein HG536_0B02880 [Torulaspora globosa]